MSMPKHFGGMRFKDLKSFNRILLAKQGRRMIQNPKSLVAQIYMDMYFKNKHFLEAELGNSSSQIGEAYGIQHTY